MQNTIAKDTLREYVKRNEAVPKKGDKVTFRYGGETKEGVVFIVDAHGTFELPGVPSYDILVEDENMLYKHVGCGMIITVSNERQNTSK